MTDAQQPTSSTTIRAGEIISEIADKTTLKPAQIKEALGALTDTIADHLQQGHKVQLPDLGTFEARERAERKATNLRTKEPITVPATIAPAFKPATALKTKVAGSTQQTGAITAPTGHAGAPPRESIRAGANRQRGS